MGKRKAARSQGGSKAKKSTGSTRKTRNSQEAAVLDEVLRRSTRSVQAVNETQTTPAQVQNQTETVTSAPIQRELPTSQPASLTPVQAPVETVSAPVPVQEIPGNHDPTASRSTTVRSTQAPVMVTPAPVQRQYVTAGQPAGLLSHPIGVAQTPAVQSQDSHPGESNQSLLLTNQGVPNLSANMGENIYQAAQKITPLASVCAPLGEGVSQSLRQKIGRGEYIDLGLLLENWGEHSSSWDESRQVKITFDKEGHTVLKPDPPKIRITTISAWTSAFLVFASIFVDFHPHRAQEMFKYIQIIRSAAVRFGSLGWRLYDKHFRMRQERKPMNPWSALDSELWFMFVVTNRAQNQQSMLGQYQVRGHSSPPYAYQGSQAATNMSVGMKYPSSSQGSAGKVHGVCFEFNSGKGCSRKICRFPHKCLKCGKLGHPSTACWAGKKGGERGDFQKK